MTFRLPARDITWKPPESVRMVCGQVEKACRPPRAATRSAPGPPVRWCHPGSNRRFAGYLTHATHHDRDKFPFLYWTWRFMTALLVGTFSLFGLHTLLWLPRSFQGQALRQGQRS